MEIKEGQGNRPVESFSSAARRFLQIMVAATTAATTVTTTARIPALIHPCYRHSVSFSSAVAHRCHDPGVQANAAAVLVCDDFQPVSRFD